LKDLRNRLERFSETFADRNVAEVRGIEIDDWLRALKSAPQTRNNFRTVLQTLFAYGENRGFTDQNPVVKTAKAKVVRGAPSVLTPEQMRRLLDSAPRSFIPYLAIGGFAGLRSAEIERLDWSEINMAQRLIEVTAENAKSAQRRLVTISDNLAAWLAPLMQKSGKVITVSARISRAKTVKAVGMTKWPENALRHSFASYHLAHHKNAATLAAELGHTSPAMLFKHYHAVVLPETARQWWLITPPGDYGNIVAFGKETVHA
jgi:integrase